MIMVEIFAARWCHMWSHISRKECEIHVLQIKVLWKWNISWRSEEKYSFKGRSDM